MTYAIITRTSFQILLLIVKSKKLSIQHDFTPTSNLDNTRVPDAPMQGQAMPGIRWQTPLSPSNTGSHHRSYHLSAQLSIDDQQS